MIAERANRVVSEIRLVNGSTGDPCLFIDYPGRDDALLFDAGDNGPLDSKRLGDLAAVFITHHHIDHFIGLDRIVRANLDRDKTLILFGPEGTIEKTYGRVKSYEHPFFPFQKLKIEIHELLNNRRRSAVLDCVERFPAPKVVERDWEGPIAFETNDMVVEAALVDHTVPCLAYALVEKSGFHPDRERLAGGPLRPGPWVAKTLELLRSGASDDDVVEIDGGKFPVGRLAERYFDKTKGSRIAYVVDTAFSETVRPKLVRLADKADRLYCDSFYSKREMKQAVKHHHMTTIQAAELANEAGVRELVLIHFAMRYQGYYAELVDEARAIFPGATAVY